MELLENIFKKLAHKEGKPEDRPLGRPLNRQEQINKLGLDALMEVEFDKRDQLKELEFVIPSDLQNLNRSEIARMVELVCNFRFPLTGPDNQNIETAARNCRVLIYTDKATGTKCCLAFSYDAYQATTQKLKKQGLPYQTFGPFLQPPTEWKIQQN